MRINLFRNESDKRKLSKTLVKLNGAYQNEDVTGNSYDYDGGLKGDNDLLSPVILLQTKYDGEVPLLIKNGLNYCYIKEWGRYYFVQPILMPNTMIELHCSIDVLMSFKDEIKKLSGMVERQEFEYGRYFIDTGYPVKNKKINNTLVLGELKESYHYYITTTGGTTT